MASQLSGRCLIRLTNLDRISFSKAKCKLNYHTTTAASNTSVNGYSRYGDKVTTAPTHHAAVQKSCASQISDYPSLSNPHKGGFARSTDTVVSQLQATLSKMTVSPLRSGLYLANQSDVQYKLPAHFGSKLTEHIIVDPVIGNAVRECPTISQQEIEDPRSRYSGVVDTPPTSRDRPAKQARVRNILIIRRKKMKKHKLNKLRKRMRFTRKIILQRREKRKRKAWENHLETFKFRGLTDEIIEQHLEKRQRKLMYMTNFMRSEAGLQKQVIKKKKEQKPPVGPIIPTPILPPNAMRR